MRVKEQKMEPLNSRQQEFLVLVAKADRRFTTQGNKVILDNDPGGDCLSPSIPATVGYSNKTHMWSMELDSPEMAALMARGLNLQLEEIGLAIHTDLAQRISSPGLTREQSDYVDPTALTRDYVI